MLDGRFGFLDTFPGVVVFALTKVEKCQNLMLLQVFRNRCCCFCVDAVTIDVAIVVVVAVGLSEKL